MTTPELLTILGFVCGFVIWLIKLSWMLAQLTTKVETMWDFQIRRSFSEAVGKGIATMNSPITFPEEHISRLEPIRDKLLAFGSTVKEGTNVAELLLKIEAEFGDDLLVFACLPCGLSHGSCLLLAYCVAMRTNQIDLKSFTRQV